MTEPHTVKLEMDRIDYWGGVGASPSETVGRLIEKARTIPSEGE